MDAWSGLFPQSHDCGLIEGCSSSGASGYRRDFPQSHDCGLIEGLLAIARLLTESPFRSLTTAA